MPIEDEEAFTLEHAKRFQDLSGHKETAFNEWGKARLARGLLVFLGLCQLWMCGEYETRPWRAWKGGQDLTIGSLHANARL